MSQKFYTSPSDERWAWLVQLHGEKDNVKRIDAVLIGKNIAETIAH